MYKRKRKRTKRRQPSNGVRKIEAFLLKHNLSYTKEYRYKDCRDKLPLPFDFRISNPEALVEFQGIQHTKAVRRFGGRKALVKQKLHDEIKVAYCQSNNIPFLVISFEDEDKIEELLAEFFRI